MEPENKKECIIKAVQKNVMLHQEKIRYIDANPPLRFKKVNDIRRCPICDERLDTINSSIKKCPVCGMFFVDQNVIGSLELKKIVRENLFFATGINDKKDNG
ncbi:MAG: hypothetical protein LUI39_12350 [Lachnospiraceae bacterium]|nr:hypothetical protein [Lachnospiraceae bacterium]